MRPGPPLLAAAFVLALAFYGNARAIKMTPPPSRESVCQEWVGFSTDDL